jgi:hypothetical protein
LDDQQLRFLLKETMDHDGHSTHATSNLKCDGSMAEMKGGTWKGALKNSNGLIYEN